MNIKLDNEINFNDHIYINLEDNLSQDIEKNSSIKYCPYLYTSTHNFCKSFYDCYYLCCCEKDAKYNEKGECGVKGGIRPYVKYMGCLIVFGILLLIIIHIITK